MVLNVCATFVARVLTGLVTVFATPVIGPALLNTLTDAMVISAISTAIDAITIDLLVISAFIILYQNPLA
jgi:hypothetical protein